MYKIGQFSILSKTTIKTLRYYEKEQLLLPHYIDEKGYRYYETTELLKLSKIISLRQIGLSIKEIREVLNGEDLNKLLKIRKENIEQELKNYKYQLSKINYLMEEKDMK